MERRFAGRSWWLKPTDRSYVAGDINFNDQALIAMGLNPNNYVEAKITK